MNDNMAQDPLNMLISPPNCRFEQVIKQELHHDENCLEYPVKIPEQEICDNESFDSSSSIKIEKILAEDDSEQIGVDPMEYMIRISSVERIKTEIIEECQTKTDADVESSGSLSETKNAMIDILSPIKKIKIEVTEEECQSTTDAEEDNREDNYKSIRSSNAGHPVLPECAQCDCNAIKESNFTQHCLIHEKPNDATLYKCDECNFQTVYKRSMSRHCLVHKKPLQVTTYKCDQCNYKTIRKSNLKQHCDIRHPAGKAGIYKCDHCDFKTTAKYFLKKHCFIHIKPEDTVMYKCDQCDYQSKRKYCLKKHSLVHEKIEPIIYKCNQCDFETRFRSYVELHQRRHKIDV